jgi:hypothetical protein
MIDPRIVWPETSRILIEWSSSPGRLPDRGPLQIRTRRFPPSGSSEALPRRLAPATLRRSGGMKFQVKAWFMGPSEGSEPHGPPSLPSLRGAPVTEDRRYYAALRLPCGMGRDSGSPCPRPTSERTLFWTGRPCVRRTGGASDTSLELGCPRPHFSEDQTGVSPVTGSSLYTRAVVSHPASADAASPERSRWRPLLPSGCMAPWASRDCAFRGRIPAAQVLACLRIRRPVAVTTARLAADLPGSALVGRDLHPQDEIPNFRNSSFPPSGPA